MDLTTEALRLGMAMSRVRAEVASMNIANTNVPGAPIRGADFSQAIGLLHQAASDPAMDAGRLRAMTSRSLEATVHNLDGGANLDGEVADLETAGADFQALTTVMSRRFSLMQLALAGRG